MAQGARKAARAVEACGVEVEIDPERLDDFEVVEAIADATDEDVGDTERMRAVVRLFRLTFGDGYAEAKRALREANGGRLTTETMMEFFTEALEAANAKN